LVAVVGAACSEDGEGGSVISSIVQERPDPGDGEGTTPPASDQPDVTAPPGGETPPPEGETPPPEEPTEDNTLAFVLAIILIVLIAVGIGTAIGGRSRKREEPSGYRDARAAQRDSDVNQMLSAASWVHDSASLEVLGAPSDQAAAQWQNVRPRVAEVQTQAGALAMGSGSPELDAAASSLSQAAGSFAGAMDSYVAMQQRRDAPEELLAEARGGVMTRRRELQAAIGRMTGAR
jgi:hypothetical protein